ncbi:multidrug effflux MFS transporter [Nakamurella sp. PAMC28650]|uniref:multidrug effflux MFS transporter n=1 Tax=Nakamurella sp. PAMC28650 TaxID=2762325 RepID=UPI00164E670D|nr:multidrug effflux MFS transporter [Nakamurella sp. PAMC28650]QNK83269.1 multidrug effflux MFS transporter [Nakamurella sp. PAMC28650]
MSSSTIGTERAVYSPAPKLARIGGTFILLLGALTAVGPFTIDMYLAAFPQITSDLNTRPAAVQLTITATLIGLALGQLLLGSISDAIGRRRPMLTGLALYIAASVGIVFVNSVELLTALRFLQGLGAAAGMVLSMAIVRDRFEGIQVGKAIARLMLVVGVSPCVAPLIGAQFLRLGSWRDMFIALAALASVLLIAAFFMLKESLPVQLRRSGGVGAATRSYVTLLRDPLFLGLALLGGFTMAALFTYISSASFVFQDGFGLSATQFAIIFAAGGITFTIGTQLNGALLGRVAPEQILRAAVLGALAITTALVVTSAIGLGVWPLIVLLVANMFAIGMLLPAISSIALERNAHRAGSAAALIGATQFGIGAATAPITGLFPEGSAVAMAAVMLAATVVIVGLMFATRPAMRRSTAEIRSPAHSG